MSAKGARSRDHILTNARRLVMEKGFAGTSIDDVLRRSGVSKGAFFHHFRSKADLAAQLMRWHAERDIQMFRDLAAKAEADHADPYERVMQFLEDFERYISNPDEPSRGCMYAVYTYESRSFDREVTELIADVLREWTEIYVRIFQDLLDRYPPAQPVSAQELAEMIVSLIEGGLVLQRAYGNTAVTARQSEHFRRYLALLCGNPAGSAAA